MLRALASTLATTFLVGSVGVLSGCDGSRAAGPSSNGADAGKVVGAPLHGEVGHWTWIEFPEARCANGESTGLGLNLGTGSDVLVFLEGGGACWDDVSCFSLTLASNSYTKANFDSDASGDLLSKGVFDRTAANNPFKDASIVYVPYCTADVHAGDATPTIAGKEVHFVGRKNIDAYLARIVPTFEHASRVTLAGVSAGGFGALLNYWRVQEAFGSIRVDLIDDSGPPIEQSSIALFPAWKESWNMDGVFPLDCDECRTNVRAIPAYYERAYPSSRKALLSFHQDRVISGFFLLLPNSFADGLTDLIHETIEPLSNMRYFVPTGTTHTMLRALDTRANEVELGAWLGRMLGDSDDWQNVSPP